MKRSRLFHIVLVAFMLAAPSLAPIAQAQETSVIAGEQVDPQRLAAAREFLEASDFDEQITRMLPPLMEQVTNAVGQQMGADQLNEKELAGFREFSKLLSETVSNKFLEKKVELADLTALVYARALTVEELNALTGFQQSPAGQKFNEVLPEIMVEVMPKIMTGIITGGPIQSGSPLDPEKERAIEDMLEASQYDRTIDLMLEQIAAPTSPSAIPPGVSEQEIKQMDAAQKAMIEQFKSRKQELRQLIASIWGQKLGIEEIKAVTVFYQTPIGQQILTSMPKIFEEQQKLQEKMFSVMFADMAAIVQDIVQKQQSQQ